MEGTNCRKSDAPVATKKRQRPRKSDIALLPAEITALGILPSTENANFVSAKSIDKASKRQIKNDDMIGKPVRGVLDGGFDAGYLISVRIGESDAVFRGAVFGPGLIIPPTKAEDIAPAVEQKLCSDPSIVTVKIPVSDEVGMPETTLPGIATSGEEDHASVGLPGFVIENMEEV